MHRSVSIILSAALVVSPTNATQARDTRDAFSDYALAVCLTQRASGPLREEGYSLASIALGDTGRSPLEFDAVRKAIAREIARVPMTTVHIDAPVDRSDKPAPLAYCLAIGRTAAVRAALSRLEGRGPRRRR